MKSFSRLLAVGLGISLTFACSNSKNVTPTPTPAPSQKPGAGPTITVPIPAGSVGLGAAAFGTNPLIINAGTIVVWTNQDIMPHTSTSDTGVWDSGLLQSGQSFSHQFNDGGTFPYHCQIHGAASMSGVIQVVGAPAPSPIPSPTPTALAPTYTNVSNNVLVPHCMSCHEGPNPSAGLDFTTWENLVHNPVVPTLVVPGNPNQSTLFVHVQGDASAVGQEHLTAEQIQLVFDWIQAGAPNN